MHRSGVSRTRRGKRLRWSWGNISTGTRRFPAEVCELHEDRTPTHGYEPTRETAMAALHYIGIHNAWDAVVYHVFVNKRDKH